MISLSLSRYTNQVCANLCIYLLTSQIYINLFQLFTTTDTKNISFTNVRCFSSIKVATEERERWDSFSNWSPYVSDKPPFPVLFIR